MPLSDLYVSESDFRTATGDKTQGGSLAVDIETACRLLDQMLGAPLGFSQDSTAIARTYFGDGSRSLRVDGIASVSGLSIKIDTDNDGSFADETALSSSDYELHPIDADKLSMPRPWRWIVLPSWSSHGCWPKGYRVQVTAVQGWPGSVPSIIRSLAIEMVRIWRVEGPRGSNRITDMDQVFTVSADARSLLRQAMDVFWMPELA